MEVILKCNSLCWKVGPRMSNIPIEVNQLFWIRNYSDGKHKRFRVTQLLQPTNVVPHPPGSNSKSHELTNTQQKVETKISDNSINYDVCKSSRLLADNGLVRHAYPGNFVYLPFGMRVLEKLTKLLDECMLHVGGQKILLPTLTQGHLWKTTGRYEKMKGELLTSMDRHDRLLVFR